MRLYFFLKWNSFIVFLLHCQSYYWCFLIHFSIYLDPLFSTKWIVVVSAFWLYVCCSLLNIRSTYNIKWSTLVWSVCLWSVYISLSLHSLVEIPTFNVIYLEWLAFGRSVLCYFKISERSCFGNEKAHFSLQDWWPHCPASDGSRPNQVWGIITWWIKKERALRLI